MVTGKRRAILISSSQYNDKKLQNLRCPSNDVDGLNEILTSEALGNFVENIVLKDRPSHEILTNINKILAGSNSSDLILIYFSGHGKLNQAGKLHLATNDTAMESLESTSIPLEIIRSYVDISASNRIILILDCCFSGAAGSAFTKSTLDDQLQLASGGRGIFIMSSSTGIQVALEKEGEKYSMFTKHLIEGIKSGQADRDNDGLISINELYDYVYEHVLEESFQQPMKWDLAVRGRSLIISGKSVNENEKKLPVVITIMGAKGGVGKTSIAARIAELIAEDDNDVLIVDFDLENAGSTIFHSKRLKKTQPRIKTVYDHLASYSKLKEHLLESRSEGLWRITPKYLQEKDVGDIYLIPAISLGLDVLGWEAIGNIVGEERNSILRSEIDVIINRAQLSEKNLKCVIFDCGAGLNPIFSAAFDRADYAFIVATPDPICSENIIAIKAAQLQRFPLTELNKFKIILNRVESKAQFKQAMNRGWAGLYPIGYVLEDPNFQKDYYLGVVDFNLGYDDFTENIIEMLHKTIEEKHLYLLPDKLIWVNPWFTKIVTDQLPQKIMSSNSFRAEIIFYGLVPIASLSAIFQLGHILNQLGQVSNSPLNAKLNATNLSNAVLNTAMSNEQNFVILGDSSLNRFILTVGILLLLGITVISSIKFAKICRKWLLLRKIKINGNNREFISKLLEQSRDKNTKSELKWLKRVLDEAIEKDRLKKFEKNNEEVIK